MTKKEFNDGVKEYSSIAIARSNKLLGSFNLSLSIDWEYEFDGELGNAIGVYEGGSVFEGEIVIGFNMKQLYKEMVRSIKRYPWSDPYNMLDEMIQTNVYHELGHGLTELIGDNLQETDNLDALYDDNQELFDYVFDNEEDAVEHFAWCMYDNQLQESELYKVLSLYLGLYNDGIKENTNIMISDKRIHEIIMEEINALDFFDGLNKSNGGLTPWDAEGKMDRMQPSNAARSNGSMPPRDFGVIRGYNDWRETFKQVMDYPQYCKKFGVRR